MRFSLSKKRRLHVRVSGLWFQYQLSVRYMPCVALRPSECTSLMNISKPASFIVLVMPNSLAALTALMVSPRADAAAAGRLDGRRRVGLQRGAEGVVGGQEVPALAAALHHRRRGAL